ncbi:MAG: hypothetical protein Q8M07_05345, partial [Prosthecobacter sp.]|nr:hypothetical protein [Prosthecobacter sp.]
MPIFAPLPDVATHVIETEWVRNKTHHRSPVHITIVVSWDDFKLRSLRLAVNISEVAHALGRRPSIAPRIAVWQASAQVFWERVSEGFFLSADACGKAPFTICGQPKMFPFLFAEPGTESLRITPAHACNRVVVLQARPCFA